MRHGDEYLARHKSWPTSRDNVTVMSVSLPNGKAKAHEVMDDGSMRNWNPCLGRYWDSWEKCHGELEQMGWTLALKSALVPIPLPVGQDPRQTIEAIAKDLAVRGTDTRDRRDGRRLLGALTALWAEDGADVEEPVLRGADLVEAIRDRCPASTDVED